SGPGSVKISTCAYRCRILKIERHRYVQLPTRMYGRCSAARDGIMRSTCRPTRAAGNPPMNAHAQLDPDMLRRYDKPGPRYTSYPPARISTGALGAKEFHHFAHETSAAVPPRPLSLYVHVPFCSSPCLYCGCNRVITRSTDRAVGYVERLLREIEIVAPLFG